MTDLHTQILPRMDDGAPDTAASLAMLRMEAAQGVTGVARVGKPLGSIFPQR